MRGEDGELVDRVFRESIGERVVLLTCAQRAGAVRPDVTVADVVALIRASIASGDPDAAARRRLLEVVSDGLRRRR